MCVGGVEVVTSNKSMRGGTQLIPVRFQRPPNNTAAIGNVLWHVIKLNNDNTHDWLNCARIQPPTRGRRRYMMGSNDNEAAAGYG